MFAGIWYEDQLIAEEKTIVVSDLATYSSRLSQSVNQRIGLLDGLAAFVQSNPSEEYLDLHFPAFAAGLNEGAPGIRNFAIAPGGIQRYVFPAAGNENVFGHNLLSDERPEVRDSVQNAIKTGEVVTQGPYELRQGGLGLVSRKAVFINGSFWGLASMVVDMPPILNQSGFTTAGDGRLRLAVRSTNGTVFFGDPDIFMQDALIQEVPVGDITWEIAGMPVGGWTAPVAGRTALFRIGGLAIIVLIALFAFVIISRAGSRTSTPISPVFRLEPLKICLIYFGFSTIWILVTDSILLPSAISTSDYPLVQTLKGILFIIVTAILLYLLIQHFTRELREKNDEIQASYEQRAAAEQELRSNLADLMANRKARDESEGRFRILFEKMPIPLCIVNRQGTLALTNERFVSMFGYTREEIPTLSEWWTKAYPDEQYRRQVVDTWEADVRNATADHTDIQAREYRVTTKSGEQRIVMISGIPVEDNFLATFVDVTGYREISEALLLAKNTAEKREREKTDLLFKLNEAQHSAKIGSWDWDMVKNTVWWSDELYRIFDLSPDSFLPSAEANARYVHPEDTGPYHAEVENVIKTRGVLDFDLRIVTPNGIVKYCNSKGVVHYDETGKPTRFAGTFMDITERKLAEEALRNAKEYAENLIQNANVMIIGLDREGMIRIFNKTAEQITGYTLADMEGKNWFEVLVPKDRYPETWREFLHITQSGDIPAAWENPILTKTGDERYITWQNSRITELGAVAGTLSFGVDITEKRQAEEAVKLKGELLHLTGEMAHVGGWEFDARTRKGTWSDEVARIHDLDPARPTDVELGTSVYTGKSRELIESAVNAAIQNAEPYDLELEMVTHLGRRKWVRTIGKPVIENGQVVKIKGVFQDITDRKTSELALLRAKDELEERIRERTLELAQSSERFLFSLEAAETGAWELDLVTHTAWRSLRHDQIFGYQTLLPAWTYEMFIEHVLPEDRLVVDERFRQALEKFADWNFECRMRRKDGQVRWIWAQGRPEFDENHTPVKMFGLVQDITDRKTAEEVLRRMTQDLEAANEQLKELDRLKSLFIASMSHEQRTPLNSIIGFTGILVKGRAGPVNDEQQKQLRMVQDSARHLLALINDVIDISKIEAGKIEPTIGEFDLSSVMREVRDTFSAAAAERELTLSLEFPDAVRMTSDERRIKQIILNLVSNAVKFTDEGGIDVTVHTNEKMVEIRVRDTGIGIGEEDLAELFKPFSRVIVPGRLTEGTGLGLYLSQRLARFLGGEITVKSTVHEGSVFIFTVPRVYSPQEET